MEDDNKNYLITIKGGGKNREINLSSGLFKFGIFSLVVGAIIFVGACGYSVYSALYKQKNTDAVLEAQKAGEIQQEQLLEISKKANELDEILKNLTQIEEELRIQAGLNPPKKDDSDENSPTEDGEKNSPDEEKHDGQGGPVAELNIADVSEALNILERRVTIRQESLEDFKKELKLKHDKLAEILDVPSGIPSSSPGYVLGISPRAVFSLPAINSSPTPKSNIVDWSKIGGNPSPDRNMPSIWPTTGEVSSPYGLRWNGTDFHPGMDIANDTGTPIVATADGVVEYAGWNSGGYGNMVDINHGNGIMTRYGHASQVLVSAGQSVKRGQIIAYMGSTGFSTGPHVHYEVHVNGQRVNPTSYL